MRHLQSSARRLAAARGRREAWWVGGARRAPEYLSHSCESRAPVLGVLRVSEWLHAAYERGWI